MPRRAFFPCALAVLAIAGCGDASTSRGGSTDSGGGGSGDASLLEVGAPGDASSSPASDAGASPHPDATSDAPVEVPDASPPDADDASPPDADEAGADDGASACPALPAGGLYATFAVGADVFHASITSDTGIAGALALWHGTSTAAIPDGKLICTPAAYNCPWHWEIDPATIEFADTTIEVCDGTPSYVEANCASFGGGSYCPWSATMTELRDCRADASCPAIAK